MTTDALTVYGKRTGSLWDRRIGGRYELVEITDTGGTGMWVTLLPQPLRDGSAHSQQLAMSVHNLGLNYVCVPEPAEDAKPWSDKADEAPVERLIEVDFGDLIRISGDVEYRVVNADGTAILEPEPAPAPLLPWTINPGWYRGKRGSIDEGFAYDLGVDDRLPTDGATGNAYERVAVIPAEHIDRLRDVVKYGLNTYPVAQAILDAADGAS